MWILIVVFALSSSDKSLSTLNVEFKTQELCSSASKVIIDDVNQRRREYANISIRSMVCVPKGN